ncbi:NAD(P)H-hydrate dehydratase [bacterium]|nr:NAD(P)H-hydrate dehydratase [bacterium]
MKVFEFGLRQAQKNLPARKKNDNKTVGGKICVIAGSRGMEGALQLTAQAASRCGAGYVYVLSSTKKSLNPDFLSTSVLQIKKIKFDSCVLGPGFSSPQKIALFLRHWLKQKQSNVVLDAEALNWLAKNSFPQLPNDWILTPHEGEMARLLKKSSAYIRKDRIEAVIRTQKKYGGVVLLKGHQTLICDGTQILKINSGNPSLAKAGSGDVLAGMIAAFLAQRKKSSVISAASLAAYLHGRIADDWLEEGNDVLSLRPVDLLERLPKSLAKLRKI